ncbi:tyrosine--tRNA ligase [Pontibacter korlensis]|uniref:Tyrosine--tRNA ligase n=1 Tax=Pontibacter korlensis TaxID=400092 RepID=A0A0E3UXA7_9BACT|nr:tyrosine--tRNA ligase [Pontibacter korlensis]AKD04072.1 tyrosyl-tRNA synthetase [Pontibacter korlensis]
MEALKENVEIFLPENGLEQKLEQAERENRKLVIKLGFDPTAPDLHLGHAIVLKKLKQFQDLGHRIVIVIGSFTARIGDPTGKNKSRPPLTKEDVAANAQTYVNQLSKILDVDRCEIVYNSQWLDSLQLSEMIQLLSKVTVAQIMHRTDFSKRFQENTPIAMHELIYPIMQGFDSVKIQADIEMGGTDQLFNCTMGRQLQETEGMSSQIVMCMPLLRGTDGHEKMSKSLNNIIGLTDEPNEMFGKVMSIPDALLPDYLQLVADFSQAEKQEWQNRLAQGENPMALKKAIASNVVRQYHNEKVAAKATEFFEQRFQNKSFQEKNFTPVSLDDLGCDESEIAMIDLCKLLLPQESKANIRRLIEGGGVTVNDEKVAVALMKVELKTATKIRLGKRHYFELM